MTADDLARFRVLYGCYGLLMLPSFVWVAVYPDSLYLPPLGPARLFDGFPDAWVLYVLELVLAVCFAALVVGVRVGLASVTATAVMVVGFGFTYSLGKIDHNVLFILTPAVLAVAGWSGRGVVRPLVLRLWALAVGLAVLSAGLTKALSGWLEPGTQATYGSAQMFVHAYDRGGLLSRAALELTDAAWMWEPLDVAAVVLECSLVLAIFSWRWFRLALAVMCVFHVGVLLLFGITYSVNVVAYAAFVPWGRVRWPTARVPAWAVVPLAAGAWLGHLVVEPHAGVSTAVVLVGGAVGAWHLVQVMTHKSARPPKRTGAEPANAPAGSIGGSC